MQIYSRLSLKPKDTGQRGNQISCRGTEMFVGSNLVLQWVPGSGKVVGGDTKMSPGRVSPGVLQGSVSLPYTFVLFSNKHLFVFCKLIIFFVHV